MGQKVSPVGLRIGINKTWESKWCAGNKDFAKYLENDNKIRKFLSKKLKDAAVSSILIERNAKKTDVIINTAKPGVIIGHGGDDIEKLRKEIAKYGYTGIYVIYDEFSKFLEGNLNKISGAEIKTLQDFAENCCRSKSQQLHILLISHQNILNYVDKLSKTKIDAWKAVSNRFKTLEFNTSLPCKYEFLPPSR